MDVAPLGWLLDRAPAAPETSPLRAGPGLSVAALEAMRRDGLVVPVAGPVYLPVGAAGQRGARAAAVRLVAPRGALVALLAAAWVHGAPHPPGVVDVAVGRACPAWRTPPGVRLVESVVDEDDVVEVGGLRLTGPARTAADVARRLPRAVARPVVRALLALGTSPDDVLDRIGARSPGAVRGRALLEDLGAGSGGLSARRAAGSACR